MDKYILFILIIAFVSFAFYGEEYYTRGFAILFGGGLLILGYCLKSVIDEGWHAFLVGTGCLISFIFLPALGVRLHFHQIVDGVVVKSAFYTHVLETGHRLEKRELRDSYTQLNGIVQVDRSTFYFLYHGNTCSIYSPYMKIFEIGADFSLEEADFGHGTLNYLKRGDVSFDLRGKQITDTYNPFCLDFP